MSDLFIIGHEAGTTAEWTGVSGVTAATAAKLANTTYGARCVLGAWNYAYKSFSATNILRLRFYLDLNSCTITNYMGFLFVDEAANSSYYLYFSGYNYEFQAEKDSGSIVVCASGTLTDAPHYIELYMKASTGAGANNGIGQMWVDGVYIGGLTNIDNDTRANAMVDIYMGGIDEGTVSGTIYFDQIFANNDGAAIGPQSVLKVAGVTRETIKKILGVAITSTRVISKELAQ